jgi:hypothetical protein
VLLGGDDVETIELVEAPDPPGATCAEASIPVKDERGAFRPPIRKLAEVHDRSLPAPTNTPSRRAQRRPDGAQKRCADEHRFPAGTTSADGAEF